jgi:hypothetical protein
MTFLFIVILGWIYLPWWAALLLTCCVIMDYDSQYS